MSTRLDVAPALDPARDPPAGRSAAAIRPPWDRRRSSLAVAGVLGLAAVVWAWTHLGMSLGGIVDGAGAVRNLIGRMLPPRFPALGRTIELAVETFFIALLGTTVATVLSVPVAILAASNTTTGRFARSGARAVIAVCRAIPDLVFAFVFARAVGIGVLPGVMALALHSVGMIGKLFADAIEQVDEGPREAVRSTGAGRLQDFVTAVLPQVQPAWIATFLYRLDINVRVSVVLGFVGGGGIGFLLQGVLRGLVYDRALGIVIVIAVLIVVVELFSAAMRRALLGGGTQAVGGRPHRGALGRLAVGLLTSVWRERVDAAAVHGGAPLPPSAVGGLAIRPPWSRERRVRAAYLVVLLAAIAYAFVSVELSPLELVTGVPDMVRVLERMFPPSTGGLGHRAFLDPMLVTIAVGVVSTALATVVAIPPGLLAAYNVTPFRWVATWTRVGLVGWRSVPELIVAVIFVAAMGLGPVGGTLALAVASIPFMAKLVADAIEEVAPGPREAVVSTGASRLQEVATSVLPQASPALVGHVLYLLDVNIRSSTILGIVGGGGIGFMLFNSMRVLRFDVTATVLIMVFVTIFVVERIAGAIRRLLL